MLGDYKGDHYRIIMRDPHFLQVIIGEGDKILDSSFLVLWWGSCWLWLRMFCIWHSPADGGNDPSSGSVVLRLLDDFFLIMLGLIGLFSNVPRQLSLPYQSLYLIFEGTTFISVMAIISVEATVLSFILSLEWCLNLRRF